MRRLVSLALLGALPAAAALPEPIRLVPEQVKQAGIVTATLAELKGGGGRRLPAQVIVPPAQVEVIAAPLPAMVAAVRVAYGETVRKGQPLVRLQGAALLELQREVATARSQAALAAENLKRDESLFADGIIAQSRLSATRAAERQAAGTLAEKRQALRLAGAAEPREADALSGASEIRAPFDGVVLEANAQPGSRVDAMTPLFKLGRLAPLWLEIQAAPAQAAGVAGGDAVNIPGCAAPARVTLVAPHLQAASQSLLIRAELAKPAGCVKPFQYAQVDVVPTHPLAERTWRVPAAALVRHQEQLWLFVETAEGFRPVAVRLVDEAPGAAVVAGDLPAEARIVVKGASSLKAAWLGLGGGEGK